MKALALIFSLGLFILVAYSANQASAVVLSNGFCPVIPEERVDPEIFVDYEGARVYLCCQRCVKKFLANPKVYLATIKLEAAQLPQAAEQSQPVPVDRPELVFIKKLVQWLGQFHFLVLHFPIALLLSAGIAEVCYIWKKKEVYRSFARHSLLFSALASIVTVLLGWMLAHGQIWSLAETPILEWHRWLGTATAGIAGAACLVGGWTKSQLSYKRELFFRILLFLAVILVAVGSHLGAGRTHIKFLI